MTTGVPYFPLILPANTVVGNSTSQAGGAEAIPISALSADLANASTINFLQAGTGAVTRTVQAKDRDVVSVFDFMTAAQIADAQAYGFTIDCAAAIQAAGDSLPTAGGRLIVPSGGFKLSSTPTWDKTIIIQGSGAGIALGVRPSVWKPDAGVTGLSLTQGSQFSRVESLYILSASVGAGTDDGIICLGHGVVFSSVVCDNFGRYGFNFDTTSSGNFNNSTLIGCRAVNNRNHGFYLNGVNSNVTKLINCDASQNGGYGFRSEAGGISRSFDTCHAAGNTSGAYYENGSSAQYIGPYSESGTGNTMLVDTSAVYCLITGGNVSPVITDNGTATQIFMTDAWNKIQVGGTFAGGIASATAYFNPAGQSGAGSWFLGKGGTEHIMLLSGVLTFDFGSVSAQSTLTTTFTLTGAKVGSPCSISTSQAQTSGLLLRAD